MAAGQQPTLAGINNQLTSCALRMRDLMADVTDLNLQVGKLGAAGLQALGATSADAADLVAKWAVIATVAAVYHGAATQATTYDFGDALAACRAGQ